MNEHRRSQTTEWFETKHESEAKSEATLKRDRWLMGEWKSEIGHRPIGGVEPPELLPALKKVAARRHCETASRVLTLALLIVPCSKNGRRPARVA